MDRDEEALVRAAQPPGVKQSQEAHVPTKSKAITTTTTTAWVRRPGQPASSRKRARTREQVVQEAMDSDDD